MRTVELRNAETMDHRPMSFFPLFRAVFDGPNEVHCIAAELNDFRSPDELQGEANELASEVFGEPCHVAIPQWVVETHRKIYGATA